MLNLCFSNILVDLAATKNILYEGGSSNQKKYLLASLLMNQGVKEPVVYETGFNVGCSAITLCETLHTVFGKGKFVSIEMDKRKEPIAEKLKALFPTIDIEVVFEDSTIYLPTIAAKMENKVDLFFVDGGHLPEVATVDIHHALRMLKPKGILVVDDTNHEWLLRAIDNNINRNKVIFLTHGTGIAIYQKES